MRTSASLLVAIGVLLSPVFAKQLPKQDKVRHALNRLTFGSRPGDLESVRKMGVKKWIDRQLHPERIAENPVLDERLAPLETVRMTPAELVAAYPRGAKPGPPRVAQQLVQAKVLRAVYSNRQLEEVLTDFWYNHFNVFLDKGADRFLTGAYERDAIRPHVLGKFRDLLLATAQSPAMLVYLDNWQSRAGRLNENYGRELLELHTLGVDGGYTQHDVIETARCFTGWTVRQPNQGGGFVFNPKLHDKGEKTVLGERIPAGGGEQDGLRVIDMLARSPATAHFVSRKLAERFVADDPPESLVRKMARTFERRDGDLREVLKTMLSAREFWSVEAYRAKVKSPFELVVSAARAVDADIADGASLAQACARMGQPLYRKAEPTGYSNAGGEWVNSAELLGRMNFAVALASKRVPGVRAPGAVDPAGIGGPDFQKR